MSCGQSHSMMARVFAVNAANLGWIPSIPYGAKIILKEESWGLADSYSYYKMQCQEETVTKNPSLHPLELYLSRNLKASKSQGWKGQIQPSPRKGESHPSIGN